MQTDYAAAVSDGTMWIAEENNRALGFIMLVDEDDHLVLDNVAVDPLAQGRGVGADLLALAEREAGRRGHARIQPNTTAGTEVAGDADEFVTRAGSSPV